MGSLLVILGGIVLLGIAVLYSSLSWGFVAWKFWYWFLLPVFPALPAITFISAVGLMLFISLFRGLPAQVMKDEYVDKTVAAISGTIAPWITLFIGWLVKVIIL